ncbi:MAG TPA: HXXEE domain-containing protein, partial [Spirochaetota bacterium]|nr:HXXEE domain-containing protein [Spirochaetota bacterium]
MELSAERLRFLGMVRALPFLFALHNAEESLSMVEFSARHMAGFHSVTQVQFLSALVLITGAAFVLCFVAAGRFGRGIWAYVPLWIQSILFFNAFSHIAITIHTGEAAPGVYTAVLVNIPFTIALFRGALREGLVTARGASWSAVAGLVLYVPVVLLSLG